MKLPSRVKLSGPLSSIRTSAVSSAGMRCMALRSIGSKWSQSSFSRSNEKFRGSRSSGSAFAFGSKQPARRPPILAPMRARRDTTRVGLQVDPMRLHAFAQAVDERLRHAANRLGGKPFDRAVLAWAEVRVKRRGVAVHRPLHLVSLENRVHPLAKPRGDPVGPTLVLAGREVGECRHRTGGNERRAVERALVGHSGPMAIGGRGRVEQAHQRLDACDCAARHPPGQVLRERGEIGDDAVTGLEPAGAPAKAGDHLVEDEHDVASRRDFTQPGQEPVGQRHAAEVCAADFANDGADLRIGAERLVHDVRVRRHRHRRLGRRRQDSERRRHVVGRRGADHCVVVPAIVVPLESQHLGASRNSHDRSGSQASWLRCPKR